MWIRRKRDSVDSAQQDITEAREHLEQAQQSLEQAREDDGRVDQVAHSLREIRRKNRFGAAIGAAIRGHP